MLHGQKDQVKENRPAGQGKQGRTKEKPAAIKPVFIDLDDAYGVPFSDAPDAHAVFEGAYPADRPKE